jgi:hypothetical protein
LIYIYHHISLNSFIPSPWQTISKRCHWFSAASDYAKEWEVGICIYIRGQATNLPFSSSDNVTGYATWQAIHLFGLSPPSIHPLRFVHAEYTLSQVTIVFSSSSQPTTLSVHYSIRKAAAVLVKLLSPIYEPRKLGGDVWSISN